MKKIHEAGNCDFHETQQKKLTNSDVNVATSTSRLDFKYVHAEDN